MANDSGNAKGRARVFVIHPDNTTAAYSAGEAPEGSVLFSSEAELMANSVSWPPKTLIDIWNRLPGVTAVTKFTDRKTAVRRIWQAVAGSPPASQRTKPDLAAKGTKRSTAVAKERDCPGKAGTKTERIIELLRRPEGATLKAIMVATGWQAHSVRGFVSAQLTKRMGLKVKSFKRSGERVYRVRS
jgi:hypothetical protein